MYRFFFFDDIKITPISKEDYDKIIDEDIKKKEAISLQNIQNQNPTAPAEIFANGNFENGTSSWRGAVNLSNTVKKKEIMLWFFPLQAKIGLV